MKSSKSTRNFLGSLVAAALSSLAGTACAATTLPLWSGAEIPSGVSAAATAVSIAAADIDDDGMPDLIVGYRLGNRGWLALRRGNVRAVYPGAHATANRNPFASDARVIATTAAPSQLVVGDFDGDGYIDAVAAQDGAAQAYLYCGDGHGALRAGTAIRLSGRLRVLAAGDVDRPDGRPTLVVIDDDVAGSHLLLYRAGLATAPETLAIPASMTQLAFGHFGANATADLVIGGGSDVWFVHGCTACTSEMSAQWRNVVRLSLPLSVRTLAAGAFSAGASAGSELAIVADTGEVRILRAASPALSSAWRSLSPAWALSPVLGRTNAVAASATNLPMRAMKLSTSGIALATTDGVRLLEIAPIVAASSRPIAPPSNLNVSPTPELRPAQLARSHVASAFVPVLRVKALAAGAIRSVLPMRLSSAAADDLIVLSDGATAPVRVSVAIGATLTVTGTTDIADGDISSIGALVASPGADGVISLREAILAADATAGADTVNFAIPNTDPDCNNDMCTIQPTGDGLPAITEALTLDASSQPGFVGAPRIRIDGSLVNANVVGFPITAGSTLVRGFIFNRFGSNCDVSIFGGGYGTIVEGNYFGIDAAGTAAVGGTCAVYIYGISDNIVGGTVAAARNVIAGGYTGPAVTISNGGSSNTIEGNYIGLDRTGTVALPNGGNDILITDSSNNTIGGTVAGAGNVIGGGSDPGSPSVGIAYQTFDAVDNVVQGNRLGTDVTGMLARGGASVGLYILFASGNSIGGNTSAARNVISSAGLSGLRLVGATTTSVQGNNIGVAADGVSPLPNAAHGVQIDNAGAGNFIGGRGVGEGNVIAFNQLDGVYLRGDAANVNAVAGNSIHDNGQLGIDLCANYDSTNRQCLDTTSVLANDPGDADSGPNTLQNYPEPSSAAQGRSGFTILGTLNSLASSGFTLDFYASAACDSSGYGEGATYLGNAVVSSDAAGDAAFAATSITPATVGSWVTATATSSGGDTSEFSVCVEVSLFRDGFE